MSGVDLPSIGDLAFIVWKARVKCLNLKKDYPIVALAGPDGDKSTNGYCISVDHYYLDNGNLLTTIPDGHEVIGVSWQEVNGDRFVAAIEDISEIFPFSAIDLHE